MSTTIRKEADIFVADGGDAGDRTPGLSRIQPSITSPPSDTTSSLLFTNSGPAYESSPPPSTTYTTTVAGPVSRFVYVTIFSPSVPSPYAPELAFCRTQVSPISLCPNTSIPKSLIVSAVSHNTPTNPNLLSSSP
ncbi:unnamed protein product [Orchesella dallaii]|uniref:Uncharacterized protein n=1 Tax=Orchesella dallaii TaxID=48710 RepID=A0ABP1PJ23_9HEXA